MLSVRLRKCIAALASAAGAGELLAGCAERQFQKPKRDDDRRRITSKIYSVAGSVILPCLQGSVLDSLWVTRDYSQEYLRQAVRPRSALLLILQCRGLETEPCGERRRAQPEPPS
jgi:hypothetical protein